MLTHASLFSGIGGAEVAAAWMGWRNVFHCEIQEFPRKVLDFWFPNAESYEDITKTDFKKWGGRIDVLTGGFPCQPFSLAGRRKGESDNRYLWQEMHRAITEIKPTWVIGENVAGITTMVESSETTYLGRTPDLFEAHDLYREESRFTLERICQDLEAAGYEVQPLIIPACAVGAPHRRDRIWIIAHRADAGAETMQQGGQDGVLPDGDAADTDSNRQGQRTDKQVANPRGEGETDARNGCENRTFANTDELGDFPHQPSEGVEGGRSYRLSEQGERSQATEWADGLPGLSQPPADTQCGGGHEIHPQAQPEQPNGEKPHGIGGERIDTDTSGKRLQGQHHHNNKETQGAVHQKGRDAARFHNPIARGANRGFEGFPTVEPTIRRGNDGISSWVDNLSVSFGKWRQQSIKAYGNAWVPQVAFEIFRAIEFITKQQTEQ